MLRISTPLAGLMALAMVLPLMHASAQDALPTMNEVENGWISLFDGESLFGWNIIGGGAWGVSDGILTCREGRGGGAIMTSSVFGDFELTGRIQVGGRGSTSLLVRASADDHPSDTGGAAFTYVAPEKVKPTWHDVRVVAEGSKVTAWLDGELWGEAEASAQQGRVGIAWHNRGKVEVASLKLRPTTTEPLFNGQDLTGWNIIPGRKSVFSVIDEAINIKDGNGQIETDGLYKDFTLQLAIISNGTHLNSGVFFRGPKGVFWRGYESQVRNQWSRDDRTKPVDYGTGGIYGMQPARKVVSSDGEWFYKTIVCHGNHMAVWIDGYQVSDFTDSRPVVTGGAGKDGYWPEAGTVHLQGHDPTTDLSFKDIRIQVYE
jgi:3-keto-disaccharide hydrolase